MVAARPTTPPRRVVAGAPVDAVSLDELLDEIDRWIVDGGRHVAVGVNANVCNLAARDPEMRRHLDAADLLYADGQSVVWASRLLGHPVPERIATTDLVHPLVGRAAGAGHRVFLFGGAPGIAEQAARVLAEQNPGLLIAHRDGYVSDADRPALIAEIAAFETDILFVGLGDPLQQDWVSRHRDELRVPAILTCGGLFDWISGANRRAPAWMIRGGLEWLWRLAIEPRRLARRYLLGNPLFLGRLLGQLARGRAR